MEQDLIRSAASGSSRAFEELITPYERRMYALALRMCGNTEDAKDCLQDAMLRIYRGLPSFRGDSSFSTWIYRVVSNVCLDFHRRNKGKGNASLDELHESGIEPKDSKPTPQTELERSELKRQLSNAIQSLPEDLKSAVVLRDIHGLSYEEIGEVLDINVGTVRSRLFRARSKLREILSGFKELLDH